MPSRRDALAKLDKKLKDRSKRVPEKEFYSILLGLVQTGQTSPVIDKSAAITSASFIEHGLQIAIKAHLKRDISTTELKTLFDNGPFSGFASKITIASALGIINAQDREDLDTIRLIRNAFAHSMEHMEFSEPTISDLCNTLNSGKNEFLRDLIGSPIIGPKEIFIIATTTLFNKLTSYRTKEYADALAKALMLA